MSFIGIFTRNETVRCWCNFVNLIGNPTEPTDPNIRIYQGNTELVNTTPTQLSAGSNIFYYDYSVSNAPTEGDLYVIWQGKIDGEIAEDHDYFKIDLTKTHVLENRLGNQRITFYEATVIDNVRNVAVGVLDHQIIETKYDDDVDWSTPRSSRTLWFHYDVLGEVNPIKIGEDA